MTGIRSVLAAISVVGRRTVASMAFRTSKPGCHHCFSHAQNLRTHITHRKLHRRLPIQCTQSNGALQPLKATQTIGLTNGLQISHLSSNDEVAFLYNEIMEGNQCTYLQHGVRLRPGDVVLDVGANIGLFCLRAAMEVGATGRVIGVEPTPDVCNCARSNIQAQHDWQRRTSNTSGCKAEMIQAAVGSQPGKDATFYYYTRAPGWSCLETDPAEVRANMAAFLNHLLSQNQQPEHTQNIPPATPSMTGSKTTQVGAGSSDSRLMPYSWVITAGRALRAIPLLGRPLTWCLQVISVQWMLSSCKRINVPMTTVSNIIEQYGLQQVGLLKVDVERGEWDVLSGIQPRHWQRIRQLSMEVHSQAVTDSSLNNSAEDTQKFVQSDEKLRRLVDLLELQGFDNIVVSQEPEMRGTNLHMLYATRT